MRYSIILVLIIFTSAISWGQQGFNRKYDLGAAVSFSQIMWVGGDTLAVYGVGYDQDILPDKQGLVFAKIDTNGHVLDYQIFHDSLGDQYTISSTGVFIRLYDNSGFVLVSQLFSRLNGVLLFVDNAGVLQSRIELTDTVSRTSHYYKLIETQNSFYVAGDKQRPDYNIDVFVTRIDKNGKKLWEKFYGESTREDFLGVFMKINSNQLILGGGSSSPFGTPLKQAKTTSKIFSIDSLGALNWSWESVPSLEEGGVVDMHTVAGGGWDYVSGRFELDTTTNGYYVQPKFIKRDSNFNLIFEKTVGVANSLYNRFYYAAPMQNGDWFAAGSVLKDDKTLAGWMYRLNNAGDSLWSRMDTAQASGPVFAENYLYSAAELPSGSIVACGYSQRFDEPTFWGWLIKVDQNGCIDTLSCTPVPTKQAEQLKARLHLYPNPARTSVYFSNENQPKWDRIEVVNMIGQVLISLTQPVNNDIDLSELAVGTYFIRFYNSDKYVVKTLVKS